MTSRKGSGGRLSPEGLRSELERVRRLREARKDDRLERLRERTRRSMDIRGVRQDAARDRAMAELERAKLASDISQSAEARALRVQRTRPLTLWVLLPIFCAFAGWSTAGVHAGAAAMTGAEPGGAMWWALWALEPGLLATVAWIILVRARLESAGGSLGVEAHHIMWGCLAVSILLNTVGHWPGGWSAQAAGGLVAHSLGPVGAAMTAHLIGVIETAITTAKPERGPGVKALSELTITPPAAREPAPRPQYRDPARSPERAWEVPPGATRLRLVTRPTAERERPQWPTVRAAMDAATEDPALRDLMFSAITRDLGDDGDEGDDGTGGSGRPEPPGQDGPQGGQERHPVAHTTPSYMGAHGVAQEVPTDAQGAAHSPAQVIPEATPEAVRAYARAYPTQSRSEISRRFRISRRTIGRYLDDTPGGA